MSQQFLTVNELAEKLNVPTSWIYSRTRQRGSNTIPLWKLGKYRRFCFDEVLKWLKEQNDLMEK